MSCSRVEEQIREGAAQRRIPNIRTVEDSTLPLAPGKHRAVQPYALSAAFAADIPYNEHPLFLLHGTPTIQSNGRPLRLLDP